MKDYIIRRATENDLEEIKRLSKELFLYEYNECNNKILNLEWSYLKEAEEFFLTCIRENYTWIVEAQGKCVGYICGKSSTRKEYTVSIAILNNLFIEEQYRNQGIGNKLVQIFKDECKKREINTIRLTTLSNNKSTKFYEKLGFKSFETEYIIEL